MVIRKLAVLYLAGLISVRAGAGELSEADFLADLPVVLTASRLVQPLADAPNAVTIIDRKLIEASGYHTLTDLFRLVPGMFVGQKTGWFHNVSHGFVDEYPHRMQVMVDGRSIYLPSIGGARWDTLPLAVDDIERIEVTRGPNAASYGANAFTGTIHIITRDPADVAGRLLRIVGGDQRHGEGWFRWAGGDERLRQRVTLGLRQDGGFVHQNDDEFSRIFSYRGDLALGRGGGLSLQAGLLTGTRSNGKASNPTDQPHDQLVDSRFFQVDYRHEAEPGRMLLAKLYYNGLDTREDVPTLLAPGAYFDVDLLSERWHGEVQYDLELGQDLRASLGGYLRRDGVRSQTYFNSSDKLTAGSAGAFAHLEWRLAPAWLINAGVFLEDYELVDGVHLSPRMTLHWQPSTRHAWRLGVSQAYRNPVLFETSGYYQLTLLDSAGTPLFAARPFYISSGNLEPERMLSQEIGYLGQWPELGLGLDLRLFRERVSQVVDVVCPSGVSADCKPGGNPLYLARDWDNGGSTRQWGLEFQLKAQPRAATQVWVNYAFLHIDSHFGERRYSPPQQAGLHVQQRLPGEIELMLSHYWVSAFEPIGQGPLPAFRRLDLSLSRHFRWFGRNVRLGLTGQNLGGNYVEFSDEVPDNLYDRRWYLHAQMDF